MSDLPDLSTTQIGYVAYWNAIDQGGVGSIDVSDILSHGNIIDYTLYDNGVTGTFDGPIGRTVNFRAKDDGWMVVYFDRTNDFSTRQGSPVRGYWDIALDWTEAEYANAATFTHNSLSDVINQLRGEFSNSSNMTFNHGDVGLYNYEYSSASATTGMSHCVDRNTSEDAQHGVIYTADTTTHYYAAIGYGDDSGAGSATVSFEGIDIALQNGEYGAIDVQARGLAPNADTEYQMRVYSDSMANSSYQGWAHGVVLTMWE